jgi:uncharacterized protein with HEPN domain
VTSSKPAIRYRDIRQNVAKIKDYLARGGGLDRVLADQDMAYDAVRMCFLEISEAAVKLGALAELHEPEIPWSAIRGFTMEVTERSPAWGPTPGAPFRI